MELVEEIDSTNRELLRRAAAGAPHGMVLVARHQTAGRGRQDRRWEAPPGASLLVSVLLRPAVPPGELHLLTQAAGLASVDACRDVARVDLWLKWPNDVVTDDGRKVAGLLAESTSSGGRVDAVVVGMGMNVNWHVPVPAGGAALNELAGRELDAEALLATWLRSYDDALHDLPAVRARYRETCATIGARVRVETPGETVEGEAAEVDDEGRLVVRCPDRRVFAVGDVTHVRPVSTS